MAMATGAEACEAKQKRQEFPMVATACFVDYLPDIDLSSFIIGYRSGLRIRRLDTQPKDLWLLWPPSSYF